MRKRTIITVGAALAAVAASVPAQAVTAKEPNVSNPVAEHLAGPLQISVNKHGIAVGQSFAATVSKVRDNGSVKNLVTEPGGENADVAGVLLTGKGVAYTYTNFQQGKSKLKFVTNGGDKSVIADLWTYEETANPDEGNTYGFKNLSPSCELPEEFGPAQYPGIIDSHPYAIAKAPGGGWYVAEAAGNDILKVSKSGNVRAVAVLKPQPAVITAEAAENNGLPECTVGEKYLFEPVPTDVEVTKAGKLIVSLLPGGPEDPSLGARGKVVKVDPEDGTNYDLAGNFAGATNVALTDGGRIFVTNLFGDQVSKLNVGGTSHYVDVPQPAALEWYNGKLYAGINAFGDGAIVKIG